MTSERIRIRERYYYSPERQICKDKKHEYYDCPRPDICPYAFCDTCVIDYLSLDELGEIN